MSDIANFEDFDLLDSQDSQVSESQHVSLCEVLDRVLTKGVVLKGDLVISVANVDLLYLGLQVLLCSAETAAVNGIWQSQRSTFLPSPAKKPVGSAPA